MLVDVHKILLGLLPVVAMMIVNRKKNSAQM